MNISDGIESNTVYGNVDFGMFKEITDKYILRSNTIMPLGSDLIGSQYKHVYVGTSGTTTFDSVQIAKVTNELSAYSLLASVFNWPGAVLTGASALLLSIISSNSPAKVVIVRLGSIEFQITLQEYKALATSLTIPFLVYYILEIFFSIKTQNRSMLDSRGLDGAVILLLLSIFYLTILPNTSYCTIQFE